MGSLERKTPIRSAAGEREQWLGPGWLSASGESGRILGLFRREHGWDSLLAWAWGT